METILYFSGHQWLPGGNGRHDGLMEALAQHVRVIYAQPPEFSRSLIKFPKPRIERVRDGFWLLHNAFGMRFSRIGKKLGGIAVLVDTPWIQRELAAQGVGDYVYWDSCPDPMSHWGVAGTRFVYDCIDPCFVESHQAAMDQVERVAAKNARVVFATADALLQRMKSFGANAHLLPNGVRGGDYHPSVLSKLQRPASLAGRGGPVVNFLGTLDWRFDAETVTFAAKSLPDFTFCIAGRVNADQGSRVAELRRLPNVVLPGAVSNEDGHAYTWHCDAAIIPFIPGRIGDAINPCKLYMYLMAGKPVIGTDTRELRRFPQHVATARTGEEFAAAVRQAVETDGAEKRAARTSFAASNRWEDRAAEAVRILKAQGLL